MHHPATPNLVTLFLYCKGTPELLRARIASRKGHFMGAQMLASQLATLEDPSPESDVVPVDIDGSPEVVAGRAEAGMRDLIGRSFK